MGVVECCVHTLYPSTNRLRVNVLVHASCYICVENGNLDECEYMLPSFIRWSVRSVDDGSQLIFAAERSVCTQQEHGCM